MHSWRHAARVLVACCFFSQPNVATGMYLPPAKYVIISNARNGTIGWTKADSKGNFSDVHMLIDSGLGHPQGLAVDQKRGLLFIADSALRKVISYGLSLDDVGNLVVDEQTPLADNVEARWVAVDGPGNVYFSDELNNRVLRVSAQKVLEGDATSAEVVFPTNVAGESSVSSPGGIATDNFYLYWANKNNGGNVGVVMRGLDAGPNATAEDRAKMEISRLSNNINKAYGVCLAIDNVFYTAPERSVYAVKTNGGEVATITDSLRNPRGCTWDGDSTVYVADRSEHGIFAFPAPMVSLMQTDVRKVIKFQDAFGVAVFSSSRSRWPSFAVWALLPLLAKAAT